MTMNSARISVALCTYNGSRFLKEQVDSMAAQTRLPSEVVVCDDGSTDSTLEMLEDFRARSSFPVRIVRNEQNLGRTKNFEKCVGLCSGDFIALSDFDDAWYPNKLDVLSQALERDDQAGFACSNADLMDGDGNRVAGTLYRSLGFLFFPGTTFPAKVDVPMLMKMNVATGSAMMIRASIRKYGLPISSQWVQDAWIALKSAFAGNHGIAVDDRLMKYRLHSGQLSGVHPAPWQLLPHLRAAPRDLWAQEVAKFCDLRTAIQSQPELLARCDASNLLLLDEKIAHLRARDLARTSHGIRLWKRVFAELGNGHYQRFSLGWKSALRDLVM